MKNQILIVNRDQTNTGGQEIVFQQLAKGFSNDFKVCALTTKSKDLFDHIPQENVIALPSLKVFDDKVFSPLTFLKIVRIVSKNEYVYVNNPLNQLGVLTTIANFRRKRIVSSFHGKEFSDNKFKNLLNNIRRTIYINVVDILTHGLVFLTTEDQDFFNKYILFKRAEQKVIQNGIETDFFKPKKVKKEKRIIFIGRISKLKGVPDILDAIKDQNDMNVGFIGLGNQEIIDHINQTPNATYLGRKTREEVREELNKSIAFILPSYSECFPMVILESMSMELPIISSNIWGIKRIVGDENFTVEPGDTDGLRNIMNKVIKMKVSDREKIGKLNRKRVFDNYTVEKTTKKYIKFIRNEE